MAERTEKSSVNQILIDFIQRNRKVLIICLAGILGVIIALVSVYSIREYLQSRALSRVEDLSRSYNTIMNSYDVESEGIAQQIALFGLLDELEVFQRRNSGYAAARAYAISASIYADQANWVNVENAWLNAAKAASKTYFAPVAYFNAAVAAEEQNNIPRAIEHYNRALEFSDIFPAAPRAQFSVGRLYEAQANLVDALFAYQTLVNNHPQDQVWVSLAHSRILFLTVLMEQ
jgi:tetratricopeptide (TPR) repeat protein